MLTTLIHLLSQSRKHGPLPAHPLCVLLYESRAKRQLNTFSNSLQFYSDYEF